MIPALTDTCSRPKRQSQPVVLQAIGILFLSLCVFRPACGTLTNIHSAEINLKCSWPSPSPAEELLDEMYALSHFVCTTMYHVYVLLFIIC